MLTMVTALQYMTPVLVVGVGDVPEVSPTCLICEKRALNVYVIYVYVTDVNHWRKGCSHAWLGQPCQIEYCTINFTHMHSWSSLHGLQSIEYTLKALCTAVHRMECQYIIITYMICLVVIIPYIC